MATKKAEKRKKKLADASKRQAMSGAKAHLKPLDIPDWRPKSGTYTIDVVAYEVVGKTQKKYKAMNVASDGEIYYERSYYSHRGIGPNEEMVVCPAMTFGEKCPVCEHRNEIRNDPKFKKGDDDAFKWSQRMVMLVYVHEEKEKGLQRFDVSNFAFGKQLDLKINAVTGDERAKRAAFFDPSSDGFALRVVVEDTAMGDSGSYAKFTIDEFIPRKKDLPESLTDHGIDLATLPNALPYADLKKMFLQLSEEEEEDGKKKRKKSKDKDDDDDDDMDDDDDKEDDDDDGEDEKEIEVGDTVMGVYKKKKREGEVKKINSKKGLAGVEVEGMDDLWWANLDELTVVEGDDDEEDDEEDDDDEKPLKDDDDDEEDDDDKEDDDDEDDDEPKKRGKKKAPPKKRKK